MKSLGASIIVFSGAALVLGGAFVQHWDGYHEFTGKFVMFVGCALGMIGLIFFGVQLQPPKKDE